MGWHRSTPPPHSPTLCVFSSEQSGMTKKLSKSIVFTLLFGLILGGLITNIINNKTFQELDLLQKSIRISGGGISYSLSQALDAGNVDFVKEFLRDNYQKSMSFANSINVEELKTSNWPFTVDEWYIKNLLDEIDQLNNPPELCGGESESSESHSNSNGCN